MRTTKHGRIALLVTILLTAATLTASAASPVLTEEVTDYGRTRWRTHYTPSEPEYPLKNDVRPVWEVPLGLSRSQPLVIQNDWNGSGKQSTRVFHIAGDRLWALNADMVPNPRKDGQSAESYRDELRDAGFIIWSTPALGLCDDASLAAIDDRLAAGCLRLGAPLARPFASSQAAYWKGDTPWQDVIYVGFGNPAAVAAIRAIDGKLLGGYIIDAKGDRGIVGAPLVFPDDTVVVGTTSGQAVIVRGLASGTASARSFNLGGRISSSPVPLGDYGFIMATDARWTETLGTHGYIRTFQLPRPGVREFDTIWGSGVSTPAGIPGEAAIDDTVVYFADKHGRLYALRLDSGELLWCRQFPGLGPCQGSGSGAPAFINNGPGVDEDHVYFVFRNNQGRNLGGGQVVALNKSTGSLAWQQPMEYQGNTAPVPLANILIVGDTGGYVRAYDKQTGEPVEIGGYPLQLSDEPYRSGDQGERWWEPIGGTATQMTIAAGYMLVGVNSTTEERTVLKAFAMHKLPDLTLAYLKVPADAEPDGFTARAMALCRNCDTPITTTVSLSVDGMELVRRPVTFRPENGWSAELSWESGPQPAGATVTVRAMVDPDDIVPESNESNNVLEAIVIITVAPEDQNGDRWGSDLNH